MTQTKKRFVSRIEEKEKRLKKVWLKTQVERKKEEIQILNAKKAYKFYKLPVFRSAVLDKQFELEGLREFHHGDFFITIPMIVKEFQGLPVNIFRILPNDDTICIVNILTFKYLVVQTYFMTDVYEEGNVRLGDERFTRKVKYAKQLKQLLGFK